MPAGKTNAYRAPRPAFRSLGAAPRAAARRYLAWAELLRRIFAIDALACTCGGRLRFIATIEDPPVVDRILRHLGLLTSLPRLAPARSPPTAGAEPLSFAFPF